MVYRQDGDLCLLYSGYEFDLGIKTVNWSPDSQLIAIGNYNQTVCVIRIINLNNQLLFFIPLDPFDFSRGLEVDHGINSPQDIKKRYENCKCTHVANSYTDLCGT